MFTLRVVIKCPFERWSLNEKGNSCDKVVRIKTLITECNTSITCIERNLTTTLVCEGKQHFYRMFLII